MITNIRFGKVLKIRLDDYFLVLKMMRIRKGEK